MFYSSSSHSSSSIGSSPLVSREVVFTGDHDPSTSCTNSLLVEGDSLEDIDLLFETIAILTSALLKENFPCAPPLS